MAYRLKSQRKNRAVTDSVFESRLPPSPAHPRAWLFSPLRPYGDSNTLARQGAGVCLPGAVPFAAANLPAHRVARQAIHKAPLEGCQVRVVEIVGGDDAIEGAYTRASERVETIECL